jgi:hypothetical protein
LERFQSAITALKTHALVSFPHGTKQQVFKFVAQCPYERFMGLFFREDAVTGTSYLETLQTRLFPRLQEDEPGDFIMQQDGAPPQFRLDICRWLNDVLGVCYSDCLYSHLM